MPLYVGKELSTPQNTVYDQMKKFWNIPEHSSQKNPSSNPYFYYLEKAQA